VSSRLSSHRPLATLLAAGVALSFALGAALITSVVGAAPASAHAVMVKITPAAGEHLTAAPTQVVMRFNEPVGSSFTTVVVTNAAGVNMSQGKPAVLGGDVTQQLTPDIPAGEYRVVYRVTSDDGHPVTGESRFTLTLAPGAGPTTSPKAPSTTPTAPAIATPSAGEADAGLQGWLARFLLPVTGTFGLIVVGVGVLVWRGRHVRP